MQNNEISTRYAKALYSLASEKQNTERVFSEIREIKNALDKNHDLVEYMNSALVTKEDLLKIVSNTFSKEKLSDEVYSFLQLLVKKGRFSIFPGVVSAYEKTIDEVNGVTRGVVRSTNELTPVERTAIEEKISNILGKKVIFTYETDPRIMGGLVVEVGGYSFDDTLIGHLRRLKDELKRSSH